MKSWNRKSSNTKKISVGRGEKKKDEDEAEQPIEDPLEASQRHLDGAPGSESLLLGDGDACGDGGGALLSPAAQAAGPGADPDATQMDMDDSQPVGLLLFF